MNSLRRFSRHAWLLHGYLIVSMILGPVPPVNSYWTDSNLDGVKEWVNDPAVGSVWWDLDSDGDFLTNAEELQFGSDPYSRDSDRDGLSDLVERDYTPPALPFDAWKWDSDDDGYSDFDEYYHLIQGYIPVVNYLNLPSGAAWAAGTFFSFSDADGDGTTNPNDSDPLNMDNDSDGILNWEDSWPDDASNGGGAWTEPATMTDSDGDGINDSSDPFPYGSYWYLGIEYGGTPSDRDSDGIPDDLDSFPDGSYWYNGIEYAGAGSDQDGDGIPDDFDSWPSISGSYSYGGIEYPGTWNDQDGDGIPDPADGTSEASYFYDGIEYIGAWVDQDEDGIPDPFDPFPATAGSYTYDGVEYPGVWLDSDSDGTPDALDATPNGGYLYNGVAYSGTWIDTDSDGVPDPADATPNGSYWWNGVEYEGTWSDQDSDGIPDGFDATPAGGYWYGGTEYAGMWTDSDGDTIPDPADLTPNGSYWYNEVEYAGTWSDADSDNIPDAADGWPNDSWNGQPHFSYNGSEYAGEWNDRDGDSVPDAADSWPDDPENRADDDNDGLTNYAERTQHFTDPNGVDSDDDYLTDYEELLVFHTNPLAARTNAANGQTLMDGQLHLGADSDNDGLPDLVEDFYEELGFGLDKSNPADGASDLDSDGVSNALAFQRGWSLVANLRVSDFDGDRIDDAVEDYWAAVYPGSLDKTIFADAVEDFDQDGLMNYEEVIRHQIGAWFVPLDPGDSNSIVAVLGLPLVAGSTITDGQFMTWWWDVNRPDYGGFDEEMEPPVAIAAAAELKDGADLNPVNGVPDGYERWLLEVGSNPPRAVAADEDGDGMPNVWEYRYQFDLRDASDAGPVQGLALAGSPPPVEPNSSDPKFYFDYDDDDDPVFDQGLFDAAVALYNQQLADHAAAQQDPARIDPDGDQLSNRREITLGTHPRVADTDNDGFSDLIETQYGSDPLETGSVPPLVLSVVSGGGQTIMQGTTASQPLVLRVTQAGSVQEGVVVSLASLTAGLSLSITEQTLSLTSSVEGLVSTPLLAAAGASGPAMLSATAPGAAALSVPFTLSQNTNGNTNGNGNTNTNGNTNPPPPATLQTRGAGASFSESFRYTVTRKEIDYEGSWNLSSLGETPPGEPEFTGWTQVGAPRDLPPEEAGQDRTDGTVTDSDGYHAAAASPEDAETKFEERDPQQWQVYPDGDAVSVHSADSLDGGSGTVPPVEEDPPYPYHDQDGLPRAPSGPDEENKIEKTAVESSGSPPPARSWSAGLAQVRLARASGSDPSIEYTRSFIKVREETGGQNGPQTTVSVVTLTIPADLPTTTAGTPTAPAVSATETLQAQVAIGSKKSVKESLLPVEFNIFNGQNATQMVPEDKEETVGAFTLANLNDTDGDGNVDKYDTDVKASATGVDEVDLMKLEIKGPSVGRMKVTTVEGEVTFWEDKTKDTVVPRTAGAFFINAADLPKTVWVEAPAVSSKLRSIHLKLGYEPPGGQLVDDIDRVKATAIWAELGANGIITAGNALPGDLDDQIADQTFQANHNSKFGIFNATPAHNWFSFSMGVEFKLKPVGIGNEPGIKYDVSRQRETEAWIRDDQGWFSNPGTPFPSAADQPNDDSHTADEDNSPKNDHVYSLDNPSVPFVAAPANRVVKRANFREFVRVRFDGQAFLNQNGMVEGSRGSEFQNWRMRGDIFDSNGSGSFILTPNEPNELQGGHVPLGNHPP